MADTTEKVIDAAADVAAEVSHQAEDVEKLIRSLGRTKVKYYFLGMVVGGITGAAVAYKVAYARANTKYSKIAEEEITIMRLHYRERSKALEEKAAKRPLEEIIKEQGYSKDPDEEEPDQGKSESPPMAVSPPESIPLPRNMQEDTPEQRAARVEIFEAEQRNIFEDSKVTHEWDIQDELKKRSPDIPYVIHYDEVAEMEGYSHTTLTYYTEDDVLANERDEVMDPDERPSFIGENTLERFGHGSTDGSIVFVRNDRLELVMEIVRSRNSYGEVVHGFKHEDDSMGNLKRMKRVWDDEEE